jgi:hypothetical protein
MTKRVPATPPAARVGMEDESGSSHGFIPRGACNLLGTSRAGAKGR